MGNWSATSLKDSDTWSVGTSSGDFTDNFPIAVPPSPGGLVPTVNLSYDSQSVDGRTSAVNGQASDIGMGWDRSQPYIERSYRSCGDQYVFSGGASGFSGSGDACFDAGQALTLSMDGVGTQLVQSGTSGNFVLKNDNGDTVQQFFGAPGGNDDQYGEYWVVTTTANVQYWFGKGHDPSGGATSSVQVEPVYDVPGFAKTTKVVKAYRWNLDYVVDARGNTETWYYNRDGDTFYSSTVAGTKLNYTRDAYVSDIYYGANTNVSPYSTGWVHFDYGYRCSNSTPIVPGTCTAPNAGSSFPDVPTDLICGASSPTCVSSPVFYHTKVLTTITTRSADNTSGVTHAVAGWRDVDHYDLSYSFLSTGDTTTAAALWLRNVIHTGYGADGNTNATTAPPQKTWFYSTWTNVGGAPKETPLPNRVDNNGSGGSRPPVNMYRLGEIVNPLGGAVRIGYFQPDSPTAAGAQDVMSPTAGHSNEDNYDVFAQYMGAGSGVGGTGGSGWGASGTPFGWFNKYLVQYTATQDLSQTSTASDAPNSYTGYVYNTASFEGDVDSGAAWRFTSNAINPTGPVVNNRAWTEYRGYRVVTVIHAPTACDTYSCAQGIVDSKDIYVYFRGMDKDCLDKACTSHKTVNTTSAFLNDTKLPCTAAVNGVSSTDPTSTTLGKCDGTADDWRLQGLLRSRQHEDVGGNLLSGYVDWHAYVFQPGGRFVATDGVTG